MYYSQRAVFVLAFLLCGLVFMGQAHAGAADPKKQPAGIDRKKAEHGRYLLKIAGCNDCHTPGYLLGEGKVPEHLWLTGDKFGWRGPWGTTYASNLRLFINAMTEDQWVAVARQLKARPPMPWFGLNAMHEEDLRALHQFIRKLGQAGETAPAYVPPDQEPNPPYALFPSPPKEKQK